MSTELQKAARQALEAFAEIIWSNDSVWQSERASVASLALRRALQQVEQQPAGEAAAFFLDEIRRLHTEIEMLKTRPQPANHFRDATKMVADEPVAYGATHFQPITGALYKKIDGIWYVWNRIEDEPRRWIKSLGTSESCLEPITSHQPAAQWVGLTVDCLGLALDLEAQAKRVESQTVERAMLAAANGLRIIEAKLHEKNT